MLIVGTGALACLFAARFSAAGLPVRMLGSWPEGLEALRCYGVRVHRPDGSQSVYPVQVVAPHEPPAAGPYALVLVKTWQTGAAARRLAPYLSPDGLALTLQNGLGNLEVLSGVLGQERATAGATTAGATLEAPGLVRPAGEGMIALENNARLDGLAGRLEAAGFAVQRHERIDSLLWGKLVINAAINPLTAVLGLPNGALLERPAARSLMCDLAVETAAVAAARGIDLPFDDPASTAEEVARRTDSNLSSMLQDVRRGAPTEIEAICGAVVKAAGEVGIPAPLNEVFLRLVTALVKNM